MNTDQEPNRGTRIGSMIVDHFAMTFIASIISFPVMATLGFSAMTAGHEPVTLSFMSNPVLLVYLLGLALYIVKDSFKGRSIAKRLFKLQVVENKTGAVASPLRCLVRNLFCIFWPIEFIVTLVDPSRRIGDLVAGTKVVDYISETHGSSKSKFGQVALSIGIAYAMLLLLALPFKKIFERMLPEPPSYVESSINESAANELAQNFDESLGEYLEADVRIYDEIEDQPNLKYVSTILNLKENYLDSDRSYESLKEEALSVLHGQFPEKTFNGQLKFVYRAPGRLKQRTINLGRDEIEEEASE